MYFLGDIINIQLNTIILGNVLSKIKNKQNPKNKFYQEK